MCMYSQNWMFSLIKNEGADLAVNFTQHGKLTRSRQSKD